MKLNDIVKQIQEDWWSKLEPDEQAAYIKAHPKSKKAQQAKQKAKDSEKPPEPSHAEIMNYIEKQGYEVEDIGVSSSDPVDYPDIGSTLAKEVSDKKFYVMLKNKKSVEV